MIVRLALRYVLIFAIVLVALSAGAYEFLARQYGELLAPAMGTPEAATAYASAMRRVLVTILLFDVPLLGGVGIAAWLLARLSLAPLIAAQERERAFAADAAHALRSPLSTIASVAQAERARAPETFQDSFELIARSALDASAVVTDLLTLARSADARALACEPLDLVALTRDTVREFEQRAADRGVRLRVSGTAAIVNGDERRIRELLRNLLSNAVRHAETSVDVDVKTNDGAVLLVVSNDGPAPRGDVRERLFQRFETGSAASDGVGLGLAIVAWIAKAHGGSVRLNETGEGRTGFVVRLPSSTTL